MADIRHIDLDSGESVLLQLADDQFVLVRAATTQESADAPPAAQTPATRANKPDPDAPPPKVYVPKPPDTTTVYVPSPPDQIMELLPGLRDEVGFEPPELARDTPVRIGGYVDMRGSR